MSRMVLFAPVPVELLIFHKHFQLLFSFTSSDCYAAWREMWSIWISFAHLHTVTRKPSPTIVCCKRSHSHFQSASDAPLDCFQVSGWLAGRREWAFNALTKTCQHWPARIHTCKDSYEPITKLFITEEIGVQNLDPAFVLLLGLFASLISGSNFLTFIAAPCDNCVNCCDLWSFDAHFEIWILFLMLMRPTFLWFHPPKTH